MNSLFSVHHFALCIPNLSLPLLVAGVGLADHPQHAVAADDDAMLTDTLDRGTNFHEKPPGSNLLTTPRLT